jgi:ABC-type metal ion transport system, periplasmic component/surface adhesin
MFRKILAIAIAICVPLAFVGCGGAETKKDDKKISIVTSIFPPYDFAKQIVGDFADVSMLLPPGGDSHSFEPSIKDMAKIGEADVFIYVGGESDVWVNRVLSSVDTSKTKIITLMDCAQVVEEEIKEGMTAEEEHSGHEEHEPEYDEHVWTSPRNAVLIIEKITGALLNLDENSSEYSKNKVDYIDKLMEIDREFTDIVSNSKRKTLVFGDRFPFRYFTDAYGLDYFAAFPGCSDDTEPSIKTISFLIDKVKAENIPIVFHAEMGNVKMATTIATDSGAEVRQFHACHNISKDEFAAGISYIEVMKENAEVLKEALN